MALKNVAGRVLDFASPGKFFRKARPGVDSSEDRWADQAAVMSSDDPEHVAFARLNDRRYDAAMKLAADRGKMAVGLAALLIGSLGLNAYQSQQRDVEVQWFAYDKSSGEYQPTRTNSAPTVPDVVMEREARRVLECTFKASFDPNENLACKKYIGQLLQGREAINRVRGWYDSTEGDGKARLVVVQSLVQAAGNMTWKFRARVDTAAHGSLESVNYIVGELTFEWKQPTFTLFTQDQSGPRIVAFNFAAEGGVQ